MGKLFTVGHSNNTLEHFEQLLSNNDIHYVLDVRSVPRSRFVPQFNEKRLSEYLKSIGIIYWNMGQCFGARQTNSDYYNEEGYLDFECFRESNLFKTGMKNVLKGLEHYNIALMCTERNPMDCHRAIMVGRGFELVGASVNHILHDGTVMTQDELNQCLLERYFPKEKQLSLFNSEGTKEEMLLEAYRKRNKEIAYRPKQ